MPLLALMISFPRKRSHEIVQSTLKRVPTKYTDRSVIIEVRLAVNQKHREFVVGLFGSPSATLQEMKTRLFARDASKPLITSMARQNWRSALLPSVLRD